ncbi:SKI complex subunit tetratricopeptide repeat protein SKI3 NDAI_0J00130 [Naumovozyma dairenensis CBS 421]|uniref:Superkiller protein 3 n=1 Tax=Naumovozyma dairenensis (strain ATCC 10597 / BCRC 20456 / CBS 421 / NBRC 0211 / NRRL Y-12639) TaxID=1071378 RepID=G0WHC5_NAUDC|nr:hypothetical protein NDAI_0J00130 [Naumovozyma dairenensis CBS 421]CCD26905.1 hypothetical protein NDAI_0J00130 [Naumovozyma dairenensis CBS 421]
MPSLKELLKEAKAELARADYEEAVKISKDILFQDPDNYFAHVFLGKAYSCIQGELSKSIEHYTIATKLLPDNALAWKGLFIVLGMPEVIPNIVTFDSYFDLCTSYAQVLSRNELPQVELIHEIRLIKKKFPESHESFYRHMRPGTPMAETLGRHLMKPVEALENLIDIVSKKELKEISQVVSRERLQLRASDPDYQIKMNELAWKIYEHSELDELYNQLINILDDDDKRSKYESASLEYRIKVLKSMPKDIKLNYFVRVKNMVEDMVLVNHNSLTAWKLFFEWQDYEDLDKMDKSVILKFFKKFPKEPLAIMLYAWICSSFSKYDIDEFDNDSKQKESHLEVDEQDEDEPIDETIEQDLKEMEETEEETMGIFEEDVLIALNDNITKTQNSALAHRIISQYYIFTKEYEEALPYIKQGISLVAYKIRDLGCQLFNTKREFSLTLATCYTYVDAPQYHKAALTLFDKILLESPDNSRAKMGKGIIFIERENWKEANELLEQVINQFPNNLEVVSEYGWTKSNLGEVDEGLKILNDTLHKIEGNDLRTAEFRALTMWRKAKTYIFKEMQFPSSSMEYIKESFKILVQLIKLLDTFAPAYSTLGDIYSLYYNDKSRAFKCYYKAFDLNAGDIVAAKYITEMYTNNANWEAAVQISERLVKAEKAKRILQSTSWPYRVLGIAYLQNQQESSSIEWFQSAIRVDPNDIESWVGLGQAYLACGRIEASMKVFEKAMELDGSHLHAQYFKALALADMGEFSASIDLLTSVTELNPTEESFHISLATTLVNYAYDLYFEGYLIKGISIVIESINVIKYITTELQCFSQVLWTNLSKVLKLFISVESKIDSLPVEALVDIFSSKDMVGTKEVDDIDQTTLDILLSKSDSDNISIGCQFLILAAKYSVPSDSLKGLSSTIRSAIWYNIGIAELNAFLILKQDKYRDAAIFCFKNSIKYQSNTAEAWIGLGISTMDLNYRVAQHCFIKAVALDPKNTEIWFNLAMLGLRHDDITFAKEVLNRSQSVAPQDSVPWLGMALVSELKGDKQESSRLFAHAFVLSNGKSKMAQILYAKSVLQNHVGQGNDERDLEAVAELTAVINGLDQYYKKSPDNAFAIECGLLALERLQNYKLAAQMTQNLTALLEKRFEKNQDDQELFNFGIVRAQFARIQLGLGNFESAIENAELSQGIMDDFTNKDILSTKISNHISLGLAFFLWYDFDSTLVHFQELLNISKESQSLVALIAKVLFDVGTEETKSTAMQELTDYISEHRSDLLVTITIAAMTIIDNKKDDLKIILQELKSLDLPDIVNDKHKDTTLLIEKITEKVYNDDIDEVSKNRAWQTTAFLFPNDYKAWTEIDKTTERRVATNFENKLSAAQMSEVYANSKNLRNIQRGLFLCPWNTNTIAAFSGCF